MSGRGRRVVAVDGPAASGKTTLARRLAVHFGLDFLDTGLLYRAVAWHSCKRASRSRIPRAPPPRRPQ